MSGGLRGHSDRLHQRLGLRNGTGMDEPATLGLGAQQQGFKYAINAEGHVRRTSPAEPSGAAILDWIGLLLSTRPSELVGLAWPGLAKPEFHLAATTPSLANTV